MSIDEKMNTAYARVKDIEDKIRWARDRLRREPGVNEEWGRRDERERLIALEALLVRANHEYDQLFEQWLAIDE